MGEVEKSYQWARVEVIKKKKKSSRQGNETSIVPSSCLQASELQ